VNTKKRRKLAILMIAIKKQVSFTRGPAGKEPPKRPPKKATQTDPLIDQSWPVLPMVPFVEERRDKILSPGGIGAGGCRRE